MISLTSFNNAAVSIKDYNFHAVQEKFVQQLVSCARRTNKPGLLQIAFHQKKQTGVNFNYIWLCGSARYDLQGHAELNSHAIHDGFRMEYRTLEQHPASINFHNYHLLFLAMKFCGARSQTIQISSLNFEKGQNHQCYFMASFGACKRC